MSMPVMSGRLRSRRMRSWRPALAWPEPSAPIRKSSASVPLWNGRISLRIPALRMLRSIRRAWPSSSSIITMQTGFASSVTAMVSRGPQGSGQADLKGRAPAELGANRDLTAEAPDQRLHMRKPDALAGHILRARAPEELEDALVVLRADAAAVVLDLDND